MRCKVLTAVTGGVLIVSAPMAIASTLTLTLYDNTTPVGPVTYSTEFMGAGAWDVKATNTYVSDPPAGYQPGTVGVFDIGLTTTGTVINSGGSSWYMEMHLTVTNARGSGAQQFRAVLEASGLGTTGYNGVRSGFGGSDYGGSGATHQFTESVSGNPYTFATQTGPEYSVNNTRYLGGGVSDLTLSNQVISSAIGVGQTVSFDTYTELVALATGAATDVNLGAIHINGDFAAKDTTISNASTGTNQSVTAVVTPAGNVTLPDGGSITDHIAEGASTTLKVDYSPTTVDGAFSQNINAQFTSTGTNGTAQTNTDIITVTGIIYTGQSTWNTVTGGSWGGDDQLASVHDLWTTRNSGSDRDDGSPGIWAGFDDVDTATFSGSIADDATITVDDTVSVKSITFNNAQHSYTITPSATPGTGSLALKSNTGTANLDDLAGNHTITAPITMNSDVSSTVASGSVLTVTQLLAGAGTETLTKTGGGTLFLPENGTAASTAGMTTVYQGTLRVDGTLNSPTVVTKNSYGTGTLAGVNGTIGGQVTIADGGTIAPGDGGFVGPGASGPVHTSMLTVGSLLLESGGHYAFDVKTIVSDGLQADAGSNYDTININGSPTEVNLDLSGITSGKFNLDVVGLFSDPLFHDTSNYQWELATFTGSISTTNVNSLFSINLGGYWDYWATDPGPGRWSVSTSGNKLYLNYTYNAVPEAGTAMLGVIGLVPIMAHRRRRKVTETDTLATA